MCPISDEPDYADLLEHCYRLDLPPETWLRELAEAALPLMGFGLGIHAYFVDLRGASPVLESPLLVGGQPEWEARWKGAWWDNIMMSTAGPDLRAMHTLSPVNYATELWGALSSQSPTYASHLASLSTRGYSTIFARYLAGETTIPDASQAMYPDSFNVLCMDATRRGVVLIANLPEQAHGAVSPRIAQLWNRLGAHVASGLRLLRLEQSASSRSEPEAIFTPGGKVEHATVELRDTVALGALREQVVAVDQARAHHRTDPLHATEAWRALHEGRYSLLDHFERDGRRYYVARANTPAVDPLAALTERENQVVRAAALGHSNKRIAYELDLALSTVAATLKSAAQKLGARSRLELIRIAREPTG
jgi:DNA-binding CsgD family transcriptional regulator